MVRLVIASIHTIQPAPRWGAEWRWRELIRAGPLPGWTARSCGPLLSLPPGPRTSALQVSQERSDLSRSHGGQPGSSAAIAAAQDGPAEELKSNICRVGASAISIQAG